jgi:hypothetical protein
VDVDGIGFGEVFDKGVLPAGREDERVVNPPNAESSPFPISNPPTCSILSELWTVWCT